MQTTSHRGMALENISNTEKRVIIRKYLFDISGLTFFSKIKPFENYYIYGTTWRARYITMLNLLVKSINLFLLDFILKDKFSVLIDFLLGDSPLELVWVHIHTGNNKDIIIGSLYCPPHS